MLLWHDAAGVDVAAQHRPLILLAVGREGGAALARWVEEHGLEGVAGVGLVGVTAPWAERGACYGEWLGGSGGHKRWKRCNAPADYVSSFDADDADPEPLCQKHFDSLHPKSREMWKPAWVLLGPLEPLRKVAERAREGIAPCFCGSKLGCAKGPVGYPLRIVVACAPDDGVCVLCKGRGRQGSAWDVEGSYDCPVCGGEGKALSSADVAAELLGQGGDVRWEMAINGGLSTQMYPTRVELDKHGLAAALKAVIG